VHARAPEIVFADGVCQLMRWDDCFVSRWTGQTGADQVRRMTDEHVRYLDAHGDRTTLTLSHVDMAEVKPIDSDVHAEIRRYDAAVVTRIRAGVTVVGVGGFSGVVVRGVIAGLNLVTRRSAFSAVVSTPREGIDFLARHSISAKTPTSLDVLVATYERACGKR
jgi:hypothetical protein